jgi:hypothetical protein
VHELALGRQQQAHAPSVAALALQGGLEAGDARDHRRRVLLLCVVSGGRGRFAAQQPAGHKQGAH